MKSFKYLYGPVPSRRLGRSLGVDLVPHKICTYDCIYCQIGKTTDKTLTRKEYVPVKEILEEAGRFLKEGASSVDHLSLGGSGEPTLHSKIRRIIEGLKKITSIPVAVITNGFLLWKEEVREDLLQADIVLPSLDAVSQKVFMKVNRPPSGFSIKMVIEGLVEFRKRYSGQIWLEILFCKGLNDHREELMKMKKAVDRIEPDRIHLNTVIRPPSEKWAVPLKKKEMLKIQAFFGQRASIISEYDRYPSRVSKKDIQGEILTILKRRPLSRSDLSKGMGIPEEELDQYLKLLIQDRKIYPRTFNDSIYYQVAETQRK